MSFDVRSADLRYNNTIPVFYGSSLIMSQITPDLKIIPSRSIEVLIESNELCPVCLDKIYYAFTIMEWKYNKRWSSRINAGMNQSLLKKMILNMKILPLKTEKPDKERDRFLIIRFSLKCNKCHLYVRLDGINWGNDENEPSYFYHRKKILDGQVASVSIEPDNRREETISTNTYTSSDTFNLVYEYNTR